MEHIDRGDTLTWKVQKSTRSGPHYFEEATAQIVPWSLAKVLECALTLAAEGWEPVTERNADSTGVSEGWATITRIVSDGPPGRSEKYWLVGSVAFINAEHDAALYVELIGGKVTERTTAADCLAHVVALPVGVRWMGSIVPSGPGVKGRIREIARDLALRYRRLVRDSGWVQAPYFDRNGDLRMSEVKIKQALMGTGALGRGGRPRKIRPQVYSARSGRWRTTRARPCSVAAEGVLTIETREFGAEPRDDGYVYLTVRGGTAPTYRLAQADYDALTSKADKGKRERNVKEAVR
jgi:hypothetical protein